MRRGVAHYASPSSQTEEGLPVDCRAVGVGAAAVVVVAAAIAAAVVGIRSSVVPRFAVSVRLPVSADDERCAIRYPTTSWTPLHPSRRNNSMIRTRRRNCCSWKTTKRRWTSWRSLLSHNRQWLRDCAHDSAAVAVAAAERREMEGRRIVDCRVGLIGDEATLQHEVSTRSSSCRLPCDRSTFLIWTTVPVTIAADLHCCCCWHCLLRCWCGGGVADGEDGS